MPKDYKLSDALLAAAVPSCDMSSLKVAAIQMMNGIGSHLSFHPVINSAFRSSAWDKAKGRSGDSAHCHGYAFDIRCINSRQRYEIVRAALLIGVPRIGIGRTFVHVDCDPAKSQHVIWHYYGK